MNTSVKVNNFNLSANSKIKTFNSDVKRICNISECVSKHESKGLCAKHYQRIKSTGNINTKPYHGMRHTPEYNSWADAKGRCTNPKNKGFKYYGGRGIKMCERWLNSSQNFILDMGEKPEPKTLYTLERRDANGDYSPDNCIWATRTTQQRNRRVFKNNKSGTKGVYWVEKRKKWCVRIYVSEKQIFIGAFKEKEDAIKARKEAELKYWK